SNACRRQGNVDAEGLHDVSRSAFRTNAAIAVFRDAHAGAGEDQRGSRRDIEGAAGIAASAARIDQRIALGAADVESRIAVELKMSSGGANRLRETDNFLNGFALHV